MVSFLLFLIVFMITYNNGTARPMDFNDSNGLDDSDGEDMRYKMPTIMTEGTQIDINGILDNTKKMFKVVLIDNDTTKEDCNIVLQNETLIVSPAIDGYDTTTYDLNMQSGKQAKFLLRLIARVNNHGKGILGVHFQVNEEGESDQLICDINFENITYIEMQEGVLHVDGLNFKFKENR